MSDEPKKDQVESKVTEEELTEDEMDEVSGGAIYMDLDNRLSAKLNLTGDSLDKSTSK